MEMNKVITKVKRNKREVFQNGHRGITLIALVITIIVLLILAGVSIATLTGENGILTQAETASEQTKKSELIEKIKMDIMEVQADNKTGKLDRAELKIIFDKYFKEVPDDFTSNTMLEAKEEYGGYEVQVSEIYSGEIIAVEKEAISKTINYVGYYADIDDDGTVDGIIYADMAVGKKGDGQWTDSYGNYEIPIKQKVQDYYIKGKYTDDFGTLSVIAPIDKYSTEEDRFYVMALDDLDSELYRWYNNAYGNLDKGISETTDDFEKGLENTQYMLQAYEGEEYGEQYTTGEYIDIWGVEALKTKFEQGWFIPSKTEWAAFGGEILEIFKITMKNYSEYNLSDWYWTSSQRDKNNAYLVLLDCEYTRGSAVR